MNVSLHLRHALKPHEGHVTHMRVDLLYASKQIWHSFLSDCVGRAGWASECEGEDATGLDVEIISFLGVM
jgi:hypothetical protein